MKLKHVEDKADEVCALLEDLAVEDEDMTELDRRIFSNESAESLGVHSSLIARLEQRCYELITVRVGREETLKALALEITSLWKQLCIPEELRQVRLYICWFVCLYFGLLVCWYAGTFAHMRYMCMYLCI